MRILKPTVLGYEKEGPLGIEWHFSNDEDVYINSLAHERNDLKVERNVRSKIFNNCKHSDLDIHVLGLRAEYAVSQILCGEFDDNFYLGGDRDTWDVKLLDGCTVSVKYRNKRGWAFALRGDNINELHTDFCVLCWPVDGDDNAVEAAGQCTKSHFQRYSHIDNFGYGPRLVIEQEKMNKFTKRTERG